MGANEESAATAAQGGAAPTREQLEGWAFPFRTDAYADRGDGDRVIVALVTPTGALDVSITNRVVEDVSYAPGDELDSSATIPRAVVMELYRCHDAIVAARASAPGEATS